MLGQHHPYHNNLRFYVVVITLVVGAIFLFLFINNDKEGISLTSAFVGTDDSSELAGTQIEEKSLFGLNSNKEVQEKENKASTTKVKRGSNEVEFDLNFDQIPSIKEEAKLEEIELNFDDLKTTINVNNDKLELNNLKEVNLKIINFEGGVEFNSMGVSIDGTASRLEVNDIALSSKGEIKISFDSLDYNTLSILGLELKELDLPQGDGTFIIEEKLQYTIENEELNLYQYSGKLGISRNEDIKLSLEGTANGVAVTGEDLNLNLE